MRRWVGAICVLSCLSWVSDAGWPLCDDPAERAEREAASFDASPAGLQGRSAAISRSLSIENTRTAVQTPAASWHPLVATNPQSAGVRVDSGRVRAIVVDPTHPKTVYSATAGGGVFKTTDADPNATTAWHWTALTDGLPSSSAAGNIAVGDLAMSPDDPQTLWLGMGDPLMIPSRGFFITHDGGASWQAGGSLPTTSIWKILALDGHTLLVGTSDGLWRSTDGGLSFKVITIDGKISSRVTSLARFSGGRILMGRNDPSASPATCIWYSDDVGLTWTRSAEPQFAQSPTRLTVATSKASNSIAWAMQDDGSGNLMPVLLTTADGGRSWTQVSISIGTAQGWYNQMLIADDDNPQLLFVGTQALYRTSDGGKTLQVIWATALDQHTATFWQIGGARRLLVGNDGGITLLRDPANDTTDPADWVINLNLGSDLIYNLGCAGGRTGIGLQDNGVQFTPDGTAFNRVAAGDGFHILLHPSNPGNLLFQLNGSTYRSTDAGQTHTLAGSAEGRFATDSLVLDPSDPSGNTVYELGGTALSRSTDFGASFSTVAALGLPASNLLLLAISPSNPAAMALFDARDFTLYLSGDRGTTWTHGASFGARMYSLVFDSQDAKTIYDGGSSGFVYRSRDSGQTFESLARNGYPSATTYVVRADPRDSTILYAGNDFGLYWSQDSGASWSRYGAGLPWVAVRDLCIVESSHELRAATFGRSAWAAPMPSLTSLAVTLNPPLITLTPGSSESITVSVSTAADLTVSGLPAAVTALFDNNSLAAAGTTTLRLQASPSAPATPSSVFTVTAVHGASHATANAQIEIVVPAADFEITIDPASVELSAGSTVTAALHTRVTSGAAQSIALSLEELPPAVGAQFDRASMTTGETATLTLTAGTAAFEGDAAVVATGLSTHRALLHVKVDPAAVTAPPRNVAAPAKSGCGSVDGGFAGLLGLLALRRRRAGGHGTRWSPPRLTCKGYGILRRASAPM